MSSFGWLLDLNQIFSFLCSSTVTFDSLIGLVFAFSGDLFVDGVNGLVACCSAVADLELLSATLGHLSV